MKIAVVTDSNSGITQAQGKELGITVLPMPFMIDGNEFFEDISLTQQEFYGKMEEDMDISTSQPSPESIVELWEALLGEYDGIVHIPMSSGLSGSCQTALMLAEEFDGRVQVVNNHRISVTQRQSALDALEMAALGTLLRLKPVLTIQGEKLDAFAKARTMKQAKSMMISAIQHDLETRWDDKEGKKTHLEIAHTNCEEAALQLKEELLELFPDTDIHIAPLSLSVACHIGPGALAIAAVKKLEI